MNIIERAPYQTAGEYKKDVIRALNQMVADWQNYFDVPPPKTFTFRVNEQDMLCLDDIVICPVEDVNTHDLSIGCDSFFIASRNRGYYRISIIWTYTDQLYIDEVSLVLYAC